LERGMNCDKRQQLYRCFGKMGSKGTPIVKNPGPKDGALRKHPLAVRAAVVRRTHKSEARNPNLETISNDQNLNDQNRIVQHWFSRSKSRGFVSVI